MAYRNTPFAESEYYHVYNRGVEKRIIFLDEEDYRHFLYLMYLCNSERSITLRDVGMAFERGKHIVAIGAYCLMPNHFHILIKQVDEGGISNFMKKLLTAYSMYFNRKYKRTGHLFEGVFKSRHVSSDQYLKYLYAYIHLNPAKKIDKNWKEKRTRSKKELLAYVVNSPHSSLAEYLVSPKRIFSKNILAPAEFPSYFSRPRDHLEELFDWLNFCDTP